MGGDAVDSNGTAEVELIDFREYLLSALFLIKFKQPVIQLIEQAFKVSGGGGVNWRDEINNN